MARQNWRGSALISPLPPALVTCKLRDAENVLTIAWCGITSTVPPTTYISVRPERHSYNMIKESGEFVINLPTADIVRAVDGCGMYTGAKVNKAEKYSLTYIPSKEVCAPTIEECPIALECRVREIIRMGSHDMFLSDIVSVSVDEKIINSDGKMSLERAHLLAYAHGDYFELGRRLACFGFSSMKKSSQKKKNLAKAKLKNKIKGDKT